MILILCTSAEISRSGRLNFRKRAKHVKIGPRVLMPRVLMPEDRVPEDIRK